MGAQETLYVPYARTPKAVLASFPAQSDWGSLGRDPSPHRFPVNVEEGWSAWNSRVAGCFDPRAVIVHVGCPTVPSTKSRHLANSGQSCLASSHPVAGSNRSVFASCNRDFSTPLLNHRNLLFILINPNKELARRSPLPVARPSTVPGPEPPALYLLRPVSVAARGPPLVVAAPSWRPSCKGRITTVSWP